MESQTTMPANTDVDNTHVIDDDVHEFNPDQYKTSLENALDLNERLRATLPHVIKCVFEDDNDDAKSIYDNINTSFDRLLYDTKDAQDMRNEWDRLNDTLSVLTGQTNVLFDADPKNMSDDEIQDKTLALFDNIACMTGIDGFNNNRDYLKHFADFRGIFEENMNDLQLDNMNMMVTTTLASRLTNNPDKVNEYWNAAQNAANAYAKMVDIGHDYENMYDLDDLSAVNDTSLAEQEMTDKIEEADVLHNEAAKTYGSLCKKLALGGIGAAYKKHEYNKAWRESVREWNLSLVCQGTMQAMEKSQKESAEFWHEAMKGPHGLLRG